MYMKYFGLKEQPFGVTPDPRFLYMSPAHHESFASLAYGIQAGRGFVALIAAPGLGKTTMLLRLMGRLQSSARTAFLFHTDLQSGEFLRSLIADLEVEPASSDPADLQRQLREVLVQEAQSGKRVVVVIDEAQNLDESTLEMVRLLSNFETPQAKLMQIILAGQEELADKLSQPNLEQLRQRISIITHLAPLSIDEVSKYISHRLSVAGLQAGRTLFGPAAVRLIAEQSGGIPRNINNLCFHALSLACAKKQNEVTAATVQEVLADLNLRSSGEAPVGPVRPPSVNLELPPQIAKGVAEPAAKPVPAAENPRPRRPAPAPVLLPADAHAPSNAVGELPLHSPVAEASVPIVFSSLDPAPAQRRALRITLLTSAAVLLLACAWARPWLKAGFDTLIAPVFSHADASAQPPEPHAFSPVSPAAGAGTTSLPSDGAAPSAPKPVDAGEQAKTGPADAEARIAHGYVSPVKNENDQAQPRRVDRAALNSPPDDLGAHGAQGSLAVESSESGAQISINGRTSAAWTTPHLFSLVKGVYRITIDKPGYSQWSGQVRVEDGEKWLTADLVVPQGNGTFAVETTPPGMQVFVDGKAYGASRIETQLPAGWHTCEVVSPAGTQSIRFHLDAGEILTKKIIFPASDPRDAKLRSQVQDWPPTN